MAIDLSSLDAVTKPGAAPSPAPPSEPASAAPTGEPLELALDLIDEDPNQPRKVFTPEKMAEMVASIKEHGVIQPVSVRPNPDAEGRWILNFGARRYRGSKEVGKKTIPAFVHAEQDDYTQVIENIQRADLTAMELALFINRKIGEGEKKNAIAKKLGIPNQTVTYHMALIDMPPEIEAVYTSERCTSPTTIYELRALYEKHPEHVVAWLATDVPVTRTTVQELAGTFKGKRSKDTPPLTVNGSGAGEGGSGPGSDPDSSAAGAGVPAGASGGSTTTPGAGEGGEGKAGGQGITTDLTSWPPGKVGADPDLMKKPLMLVEFDGRCAAVLLNRRPSEFGLIRIKYEDNGEEAEVDAGRAKINSIRDEKA